MSISDPPVLCSSSWLIVVGDNLKPFNFGEYEGWTDCGGRGGVIFGADNVGSLVLLFIALTHWW